MEENVDEAKRVGVFRLYFVVAEGKERNIIYFKIDCKFEFKNMCYYIYNYDFNKK